MTVLLVLTVLSLVCSAKSPTNVFSVAFLLAQARPGLPHQGVASSRHLAELLSSSWKITYSVSYTLRPYQKEGS